jgi:hypothetical protein
MAMLSESARATTAAESRFRINDPNSLPRSVKVIAMDAPSERAVKELAKAHWNRASFLTASSFASAPREGERFSMKGWLSDLAGRTRDLMEEIESADLVVMVATVGEDPQAAAIIGEMCALKRVMTTVLVLGSATQSDAALTKALGQLRPHAVMLVIASAEEYLEDMLRALRA